MKKCTYQYVLSNLSLNYLRKLKAIKLTIPR